MLHRLCCKCCSVSSNLQHEHLCFIALQAAQLKALREKAAKGPVGGAGLKKSSGK